MKVMDQARKKWSQLSKRERRVIKAKAKGAPKATVRNHCKIILAVVRFVHPEEIQRGAASSVSQVYRVVRRFLDDGPAALADRREDNGESNIDERFVATLFTVVDGSPQEHGYRRPTWTQELLILVLHKRTDIRISRSTMCRLLKRLKIRLGAPKPTVGCPWKKARRSRRLNQIQRLIASLPQGHVAVYMDEVDIHLNPKIGRDWMRSGTQKYVRTPGKNQKRYLAGSLDVHTGQLTYVEADRKDSDLFIRLLWHLARKIYPRAKCIHIILDNYKIHSSERTQLALGALGDKVRLHFLPPYCPDHNRIERTWRDLHDNVTRNHQCRNLNELMNEVRYYVTQRDKELRKEYATKQAA